jgi:hypothetical protein
MKRVIFTSALILFSLIFAQSTFALGFINLGLFTLAETNPNTKQEITHEIFDPFSGIIIEKTTTSVFFSYADSPQKTTQLQGANPKYFRIISSGTEIIAIDEKNIYLIKGEIYEKISSQNPSNTKIIRSDDREVSHIIIDGNTYPIKIFNL